MTDIIPAKTPTKRRRFSQAFKAEILAACDQPGASIAAVAQANGLNANLVHKWRHQAKSQSPQAPETPDFLPLALPAAPLQATEPTVTFEVGSLTIHWPLAQIDRSIAWLRDLQA